LKSEEIAFITATAHGDSSPKFYLGANDVFTEHTLSFTISFDNPDRLSFGKGSWLYADYIWARISADGSSVLASDSSPAIVPSHLAASTTGITYHNKQAADVVIRGTDNLTASAEVHTGDSITFGGTTEADPTPAACDPTGTFLMTRGIGGGRAKSSDSGATWGTIADLPVNDWSYCYAGPNGSTPRFIAVGAYIYYSPDFGTTWVNKQSDSLVDINPLFFLNMARIVEY
jgi:hypothetical protein